MGLKDKLKTKAMKVLLPFQSKVVTMEVSKAFADEVQVFNGVDLGTSYSDVVASAGAALAKACAVPAKHFLAGAGAKDKTHTWLGVDFTGVEAMALAHYGSKGLYKAALADLQMALAPALDAVAASFEKSVKDNVDLPIDPPPPEKKLTVSAALLLKKYTKKIVS